MVRAGVRSSYAGSGGNRVNVEGPMRRRCPKCDAAPGWRCGRYVGALWTPNATFHAERRASVRPVRRMRDATRTRPCRELRAAVLNGMAHEEFKGMFEELGDLAEGG